MEEGATCQWMEQVTKSINHLDILDNYMDLKKLFNEIAVENIQWEIERKKN